MLWLLSACGEGDVRSDPAARDSSVDIDTGDDDDDSDVVVLPAQPNVLVVIADDLGVDRTPVYPIEPDPPPMPNLEALAAQGMVFEHAYAYATCSPTRATLLTGRHGFRTGVGRAIEVFSQMQGLGSDEIALPAAIADQGYANAAVGKWHLASLATGLDHPRDVGFDSYDGSMGNILRYDAWTRFVDGVPQQETTYATTLTTDVAIDRVTSLPEPWLVWVGYNAPHAPYHVPPSHLHGQSPSTPTEAYDAMVEAMDTELGRLLDAVDLDTTLVVFVGDNGTPKEVVRGAGPPPERAKGSLFEGGVRVPLVVAGFGTEVGRTAALTSTVDLFPTVTELAGGSSVPADVVIDGVSLVPVLQGGAGHTHVFSERFAPNGDAPTEYMAAVRDDRFRLLLAPTPVGLYDQHADVWGGDNLLLEPLEADAQQALVDLTTHAVDLLGTR